MEENFFNLQEIPLILYGKKSNKVFLFVHGQGGNKEEGREFAKIVEPLGYQVLAMDLPGHGKRKDIERFIPSFVSKELSLIYDYAKMNWSDISLRGNSIGSYFSMLAFIDKKITSAYFVSPLVNMENIILNMIKAAGISENTLKKIGEYKTTFGQTLSWSYLTFVREHPLNEWTIQTFILYPGHDNLTSRDVINDFTLLHNVKLTIYEDGEHWFHTKEQTDVLNKWLYENIN